MIKNDNAIIDYLKYLKDVSRKISLNAGFENTLLSNKNKKRLYVLQIKEDLTDGQLTFSEGQENFRYLKEINDYLNKYADKKLFFGAGLICGLIDSGRSYKRFAGPLLIAECDITRDEHQSNQIICEIKLSTLVLNYDLISSILERKHISDSGEDEDYYDPKLEREAEVIEEIEEIIEKIDDISDINRVTEEIFTKLQKELEEFKDIRVYDGSYDYEEEKEKLKKASIFKASIFDTKGLVFVNANHLFVESIPNELSAYESLSLLIKEIEEEGAFQNRVLENLLSGAFSGNPKIPFEESIRKDIEELLDFLPISLSERQRQALINAFSSDISYIQGPPGTGKSHTILAMVLLSVLLGKKVLVVSQKVPAVKVINEKVTPFLKFDEKIPPVIYYNKDIRTELKESIRELELISDNKFQLSKSIEETKKELSFAEESIKKTLEKLREDEKKLLDDIDRENKIYKLTRELESSLKNFEEKYFEVNRITKKVQEKKLELLKAYLEKLKLIEEKKIDNLVTLRFRLKLLEFIAKELPEILKVERVLDLFRDYVLHRMMEDLREIIIKVNSIMEEERMLLRNRDLIRKDIELNKKRIEHLGKDYIRLKNKYNILSKLIHEDYYQEVRKFSKLLRLKSAKKIAEIQKNVDWDKILDIYPVWVSEIRHINEILPMKENIFDLVVVDEASQVNLAEIIPVFYRGKKICIVGDHKQLSLVSTGLTFRLSKNLDRLTWEKYKPNNMSYKEADRKKLTVTTSSILDFIRSEENGFSIREVMLDEHFRSLPMLAKFTNEKFYENKLKIMTETPDKALINPFFPVKVEGKRSGKSVMEEAEEVVSIIRAIIKNRRYGNIQLPELVPDKFSIGVLSFTREQVEILKDKIYENFSEEDRDKYDIIVGTPEELQGHERDVMIISFAVDESSERSKVHYERKERFNVATSRAKYFTFFIYSGIPKNFGLTISYFKHFGFAPHSEEEVLTFDQRVEAPEYFGWTFNPEAFESEFEKLVCGYLLDYIEERKKQDHIKLFNQVKACGQGSSLYRLDFVLYNPKNKKFVAVEVDGIHHFELDGRTYSQAHKERIEILKRAGWNVINTPYYRWYRGGWLDKRSKELQEEIEKIYRELDKYLLTG